MVRGAALAILLGVLGCQPAKRQAHADAGAAGSQEKQVLGGRGAADGALDSGTVTDGATEQSCPAGMLKVSGKFCPYMGHRCAEWISEKQDRCRRYAEPPICEGRERPISVCVDEFEYPNQTGVYPVIMVSFIEAQAACEREGKRLCTESEWTLACEGNERLPYPYGYERDPTACNIDRPYGFPDLEAFDDDRRVAAEVGRLDQRVASGSMPRCKSPFGIYDMTGNVDEWVINETRQPDSGADISGLKGGYFGPIRARCRPMTSSHNRWFRFYQVGFRCCSDPQPRAPHGEPSSTR
jgi:sulfatase modifying factor 1